MVFKPTSKRQLQEAVELWNSNRLTAIEKYGEINTWDTSEITDMRGLFKSKSFINDDISNWDVSKVSNMSGMFYKSPFIGDISNWNVSKVETLNISPAPSASEPVIIGAWK